MEENNDEDEVNVGEQRKESSPPFDTEKYRSPSPVAHILQVESQTAESPDTVKTKSKVPTEPTPEQMATLTKKKSKKIRVTDEERASPI